MIDALQIGSLRFVVRSLRVPSSSNRFARQGSVIAGAACLLAMGALAWHIRVDRQLGAVEAQVMQNLRPSSLKPPAHEPGFEATDFVQRMPVVLSVDPLVRALQHSSAEQAVTFVAIASASKEATVQALGRTDLTITLRGGYGNLKAVLADTMTRFPQLVAQRLALRRAASPTDLEARVDLVLLVRPLPGIRVSK